MPRFGLVEMDGRLKGPQLVSHGAAGAAVDKSVAFSVCFSSAVVLFLVRFPFFLFGC